MQYTINVKGQLVSLAEPQVMGIVNVTPDSFFAGSRVQTADAIACRVNRILDEGGTMIDVGACSTRPDAVPVDEQEEMERLRFGLDVVRRTLDQRPSAPVGPVALSVDTFRPDVARMAVEEFGADIINDVGGPSDAAACGQSPKDMFRMVARLRVPYILMSRQPDIRQMLLGFADGVRQLRDMGQKDIVLDPGFGFGKTLEQNYLIMSELDKLAVMELPLLVGISRKSMIYRLLGTTADDSLNGTTALNTIALMKGASILRVHDVREAVECCQINRRIQNKS